MIIFTLILLYILWYLNTYFYNKESFNVMNIGNGQYTKLSNDCYTESPETCLNYSNCGLCQKNGKQKCLPGDVNGPYYHLGCNEWEYLDNYDERIYDKKNLVNTVPFDHYYPNDYEMWYPPPHHLFT